MSSQDVTVQVAKTVDQPSKAAADAPFGTSIVDFISARPPSNLEEWSAKQFLEINKIRNQIDEDLAGLRARSIAGDKVAIATLHYLARKATITLNHMGRVNPSIVIPLAQVDDVWPVMMGLSAPIVSLTKRFLQAIQLGQNPDSFDPEKLYKRSSPARSMAVRTVSLINAVRQMALKQRQYHHQIIASGCPSRLNLSAFMLKCEILPEFSEQTVDQWFPLCRELILERTGGHPEKVKCLRSVGLYKAKGPQVKYKESRIRAAIFEQMKRAMEAIAKGSPARARRTAPPTTIS